MTTGLQSGGELLIKEYLDLRLDALSGDLRKETTRLILWLVPTVFGGMAAAGALVGVAS